MSEASLEMTIEWQKEINLTESEQKKLVASCKELIAKLSRLGVYGADVDVNKIPELYGIWGFTIKLKCFKINKKERWVASCEYANKNLTLIVRVEKNEARNVIWLNAHQAV